MDEYGNPVVVLDETECWQRLRSQVVGRIFMQVGDVLDVFPVNYVVDDESILLRTAEGTKFAELMVSTAVLFEADDYNDESAWSVVLRGTARRLETEAEIVAAEALPLRPMVPTLKRNFVRITATSLSGRWFARTEEPTGDGPQPY